MNSRTSADQEQDRRGRAGRPGGEHAVPGRDDRRARQVGPEHPAAVERQGREQVGEQEHLVQIAEPADAPDRASAAWRACAARPPSRRGRRRRRRCRTGYQTNWAPANRFRPTAMPRNERAAGRPARPARPGSARPTRRRPTARPGCPAARAGRPPGPQSSQYAISGVAQLVDAPGRPAAGRASRPSGETASARPASTWPARASSSSERDEHDQEDVDPDRRPEPPAQTDRRPGQRIGHGRPPGVGCDRPSTGARSTSASLL